MKRPTTIAEKVQQKVDEGYFRHALLDGQGIPFSSINVLVRQATKQQILSGRYVDDGTVRQALKGKGWTATMIDYLLFRDPQDGRQEL